MAALSLGLHLVILLPALVIVRLPALPTEPPSVEVMIDAGPTAAGKLPPSAVPTADIPTEAVPPAAAPPPTPEAEAQPPPPPPDATDLASLAPPPPPAPPDQPEAARPPPVPSPPQLAGPRTAPRRASAPAPTAAANAPREALPAPGAATPAAEAPESYARVEGADLGPDWIRQLQAWWDRHAFFPGQAAEKSVSGTVKVHLVVRPDGEVTTVHVVQSSGSKYLDNAAYQAFQDARLHPFPPGTPAPKADVYITLHYILAHGQDVAALLKRPFTVTNKPVQAATTATMQQKSCTGVLVLDTSSGELDSWRGRRTWAQATFYRIPDGKPRVTFRTSSDSFDAPISELDGSAGWLGREEKKGSGRDGIAVQLRYALWPAGADHVGGSVVDVYNPTVEGTIDLTCNRGPSEQARQ